MRGRPSCLLQSAGGEANRILLASALSSMRIICPTKVSRRDWIIAVSLGCFVSLRTSSFRTNWYQLMPSSICRHHWSSASILRASVLDIAQQSEQLATDVHGCNFVWVRITSHTNPVVLLPFTIAMTGLEGTNPLLQVSQPVQLSLSSFWGR